MTLATDISAAETTIETEMDNISFLDNLGKAVVDQELIDSIQADMDQLTASCGVVRWERSIGSDQPRLSVSAQDMAHMLCDQVGDTVFVTCEFGTTTVEFSVPVPRT